jgi:transcriptional regulator with XRE-family HTH domain
METGRKIRNARRDAMMSQNELAIKCDMHNTHISAYERGVRIPKLDTIVTIAKALNVSPMSLLPDSFLEANKKITKELEANTNA